MAVNAINLGTKEADRSPKANRLKDDSAAEPETDVWLRGKVPAYYVHGPESDSQLCK